MILLKRAYEKTSRADGVRILVERLWPRGLSRQQAKIDLWMKDIAPSPELRKWFGHDPSRWKEFKSRYKNELKQKNALLKELKEKCDTGTVTFVFAARDPEMNSALVLKEAVEKMK